MYFRTMTTGLGQYFANTTMELMDELNICLNGSYTIIFPRLYNLSYAQFLRMVRDVYGATLLKGNNKKYIHFYFTDEKKCNQFVKDSNERFVKWKESKNV